MWRIFVDTGGTFTDALGIAPDGGLRRAKVLSSAVLRGRITGRLGERSLSVAQRWGACDDLPRSWPVRMVGGGATESVTLDRFDAARSSLELAADVSEWFAPACLIEIVCPEEAPLLAARVLTGTPGDRALPPMTMRLATTRGTNALLTRAFPQPALFITSGLGDLLEIGTQQRPDLFALDIRKPAALHGRVVEVDERLSADGAPLRALDETALARDARAAFDAGFRTAAVALLHSDLNPIHELAAAAVLRRTGFEVIALSHVVSPFVKLLPRAITAVVEAALAPVVSDYVSRIDAAVSDATHSNRLAVLTSTGGLVKAAAFRATDSLLSGPAGGVLGAGAAAAAAGEHEILAFDVGGTSTDVSRWTRQSGFEHAFEHSAGECTLVAPAIRIHTVAAGGGSICGFDGAALTVGPASAGADPGPACYGRGGPLTLTDVQLLAGRIHEARFGVPLDHPAAETALAALLARLHKASGGAAGATREMVLDGLLDIAAERVAGAIRVISSRRGHDPRSATLLAFGGAGGQLACLVAERLEMTRVLVPRDAGLLSARGLMDARFQAISQRQVMETLDRVGPRLSILISELTRAAESKLRSESGCDQIEHDHTDARIDLGLRCAGQESTVEIEYRAGEDAHARFVAEYQRLYGYRPDHPPENIELVWARAMVSGGPTVAPADPEKRPISQPTPASTQPLRSCGREHDCPVVSRDSLNPGDKLAGPALIHESHSTTVVEAGWSLSVGADGSLALTPDPAQSGRLASPRLAAADVELFTSRIESVANAMGAALQRTSVSVNVKERLDYSCAVLDSRGQLVACAPHVPVHLGSLGVCVREVLKRIAIEPGDVVVTNHPACGGSHLPDVTVIMGAFRDHDPPILPIGYVAARAHHAEIGGIRPGSMPPGATRLSDEGVVIPPQYAARGSRRGLDELRTLLACGGGVSIGSRAVDANMEDLAAAIAACRSGVAELQLLAERHGAAFTSEMMDAIQQRSAAAATETICGLGRLDLTFADEMDDGSPLRVRIMGNGHALTFDFTGSAPVHPGNLNATPAIVQSCLVYIMRLLVGRDLPLNEGLMRPVHVVLPPGMLNPPFDADADPRTQPAVVGGNVETSQRLVNMIIRGLGLCAESQGTMNNLIFGDATRSYYETICGGAGAGPGFHGASAVHTHMTNTRITDPEILERRYPVRLERFAVRRGSGGAGTFSGGDGVERVIRFLAPMSVSVLTQRRVHGPHGLGDGADGAPGEQWIEHADATRHPLAPCDAAEVRAGDAIVMRTPGGGACG